MKAYKQGDWAWPRSNGPSAPERPRRAQLSGRPGSGVRVARERRPPPGLLDRATPPFIFDSRRNPGQGRPEERGPRAGGPSTPLPPPVRCVRATPLYYPRQPQSRQPQPRLLDAPPPSYLPRRAAGRPRSSLHARSQHPHQKYPAPGSC